MPVGSMDPSLDPPGSRLLLPTKCWAQRIGIDSTPDIREQRRLGLTEDAVPLPSKPSPLGAGTRVGDLGIGSDASTTGAGTPSVAPPPPPPPAPEAPGPAAPLVAQLARTAPATPATPATLPPQPAAAPAAPTAPAAPATALQPPLAVPSPVQPLRAPRATLQSPAPPLAIGGAGGPNFSTPAGGGFGGPPQQLPMQQPQLQQPQMPARQMPQMMPGPAPMQAMPGAGYHRRALA